MPTEHPRPGSQAALAAGCTCNSSPFHRGVIYHPDCRVHYPVSNPAPPSPEWAARERENRRHYAGGPSSEPRKGASGGQ